MFSAARAALGLTRGYVRNGGSILSKPGINNNLTALGRQHTKAGEVAKPRSGFSRQAETRTVKEEVVVFGHKVVVGSTAVCLGTLCYYGLDLANEPDMWTQQVKDRIRETYAYFGASAGIAAASAVAFCRSPTLARLAYRFKWPYLGVVLLGGLCSVAAIHEMPREEDFGKKQLAWLAFTACLSLTTLPLAHIGGQMLLWAAWYASAMVGGLTAVAVCAPNKEYLCFGGILAIDLTLALAISSASLLAPGTAVGLGTKKVLTLYGAMFLFGLLLVYNTQKVVVPCAKYNEKYDPIRQSVGVYLHTFINWYDMFARLYHIKKSPCSSDE